MTLEADLLLDRRRLKSKLLRWRVLAVVLGAVALAALLPLGILRQVGGDYVSRLEVTGTIGEDRRVLQALDRIRRDENARALILYINSPGGSVAGGQSLHDALRRLAAEKPVVAVMGGTAASAGYMIALPAARIFAREGTLTGSIGVLMQSFEASELLARIGVRPETIASGILKDQPSPFRPLSPEGRAALEAVVQDIQSQFVTMVSEGRRMPEERVRALADGRVFSGRQALAAGLVDQMGGEVEARAWLAENREIAADLPLRTVQPRGWSERMLGAGAESLARALIQSVFGQGGLQAALQH
jgi:protease-4